MHSSAQPCLWSSVKTPVCIHYARQKTNADSEHKTNRNLGNFLFQQTLQLLTWFRVARSNLHPKVNCKKKNKKQYIVAKRAFYVSTAVVETQNSQNKTRSPLTHDFLLRGSSHRSDQTRPLAQTRSNPHPLKAFMPLHVTAHRAPPSDT